MNGGQTPRHNVHKMNQSVPGEENCQSEVYEATAIKMECAPTRYATPRSRMKWELKPPVCGMAAGKSVYHDSGKKSIHAPLARLKKQARV